jgi:peptidoglycan/LPS O-acetylase OafA/YrhL
MTATSTAHVEPLSRPRAGASSRAGRSHGFRPDIEGLRAVAIGLVLVYHAGVRWVPGGFVGVDVFFVISGFLITTLLVREAERTGRIALARFYARRARRLLPAAALTLLAAAFLTWWLLPVTQRRVFGGDIVSAAFYVVNWRLAARSVDYLAEGVADSPVQHFWSLAVEEQFYLIWPFLIIVALLVARRLRLPLRPTLGVALALVVVPSLAWSIHQTAVSPSTAFFVTTTRLWELGIGAAVAVGAVWWTRLPRAAGIVLGLLGGAGLVASGLLVTADDAWPGSHALLPVLATAAVIVAGASAADTGLNRLLAWAPLVWVGGLSYSLYLWHWLFIVGGTAHFGTLGAKRGLLLTAVAFVPAWLSHRFVENPVRFSPRLTRANGLSLSVGANLSLVAAVAGLVLCLPHGTGGGSASPTAPSSTATATFGAAAVLADPVAAKELWKVDTADSITPAPDQATSDVPDAYDKGCQVKQDSGKPVECVYGDPDGAVTVALVGDSKALQWITALDAIGKQRGWRVVTDTKSTCAFTAADVLLDGKVYSTCSDWNDATTQRLLETKPDIVLTSQQSSVALPPEGGKATKAGMQAGLEKRWTQLQDAGITVVPIANNAAPDGTVYECVAEHPDALSTCAFKAKFPVADVQRAAAATVGAPVLDLTDVICPGGMCPAVIGDVLVYRQGSHLTRTFVGTLQGELDRRLGEALAGTDAAAAATKG